MSDISCICCKQLSDDNHKNLIDEKSLIEEPDGYNITLKSAVELITGYTISEIDNEILCETCFHKVKSYMKFRSQLIDSFERFNKIQISNLDSSGLESADITNTLLISKVSNTGSDVSKEMINGNENNISTISNNLSSSETENDSSYIDLLWNYHHYILHHDNASDYGSDIDDNLNVDVSRTKIQKSDIESDVNVCSGEDDEILELSVEYKQHETINISSTESEEDCDYGPNFKKIKLLNQIPSPLMLS